MKKKIRSVAALLLTASMLFSAHTSISAKSSTEQPAKQSASKTDKGEAYSLPLVKDGSVTISIATVENPVTGFGYATGLEVWEKLSADTGVKIDWQVTPSSEYNTVIQTRLAAGSGLPDFIRIPSNPMKYISDGIIIPLSEQLEKNGYYTKQLYEENNYIKPFVSSPDGEVYFFTSDVAGAADADPYVYMVREDWLNKFDLNDPETLEDWYNTWKIFLEQDANGNGQKDEIPFCNDNTLIGTTIFGNTLGLKLHRSSGWSVDSNGKVAYDYIKPEMKELLTWLNKCFSEGLIDQEFATQKWDTLMKKVSMDQSGSVFRALNGLVTFNKALEDAGVEGNYKVVAPPKSTADSTIPQYVERYGPISGLYGFSKDCKDLDTKFKFIDYVYASQEGNYAACFGIEGKTYTIVDGKPKFTDYALNNPEGKTMNELLQSLGCSPQIPWNRSLNGYWSYMPMEGISGNPATLAAAEMYTQYNINNFPQGTILTEDEQEVVGQYLTDLLTYQDEMITKFIMGTEPLSKFDQYVKNIENLGLSKVLEVRQAQWERYNATTK